MARDEKRSIVLNFTNSGYAWQPQYELEGYFHCVCADAALCVCNAGYFIVSYVCTVFSPEM